MPAATPRVQGGAQQQNSAKGSAASDNVTLTIGGTAWSGWTAIRISRGIERFPSDFELALTELYPGEAGALLTEPGTPCTIKIGNDLLITGAVDRYLPAITPKAHEVRMQGRSLCRALTDCSAGVIPPSDMLITQFSASSVLGIAQQLASPLGLSVSSQSDAANQIVPALVINLSETPSEILDRITRYAGLLYYDGTDGNLVLAQVGSTTMASGFEQGVNIESASATFSADQRFSDYIVVWMSNDGLTSFRAASDSSTNGNTQVILKDGSTPSIGFRPHIIVSEQVNQDNDFGLKRATWEMNRRNGRSRAVVLTTDTWRDSAGTLWTPNALVTVNAPTLKISNQQWLIGEVTYRRDESGTHADLVLMPPAAYQPEPYNLQPINRQVAAALQGGAQKDQGITKTGAP